MHLSYMEQVRILWSQIAILRLMGALITLETTAFRTMWQQIWSVTMDGRGALSSFLVTACFHLKRLDISLWLRLQFSPTHIWRSGVPQIEKSVVQDSTPSGMRVWDASWPKGHLNLPTSNIVLYSLRNTKKLRIDYQEAHRRASDWR